MGRPTDRERIEELIAENPHNVRSRHVAHNLGKYRIEWARRVGITDVWA